MHMLSSAILLGSIKVPYKEIKERILQCDSADNKITPSILGQLIKTMPKNTEDVLTQLAEVPTDEYEDLVEAEHFLAVVCFFILFITILLYFILL